MGKPLIISLPLCSTQLDENSVPPLKENGENQVQTENNKLNSNAAANLWYLIVGIMPLAHTVTDIQRKK